MIKVCECQAYGLFNDDLDEIHGDIQIFNCSYSATRVLREVDPIAYRCYFGDFCYQYGIEIDDDVPFIDDIRSLLEINDDGEYVFIAEVNK